MSWAWVFATPQIRGRRVAALPPSKRWLTLSGLLVPTRVGPCPVVCGGWSVVAPGVASGVAARARAVFFLHSVWTLC